MTEREFNLLHEPWIRVTTEQGTIQEMSLLDVLIRAHEFQGLAGELVTQDVAVLRLLLAVLQTIVYRFDEDGEEDLLEEPGDALRRWKKIWDRGHFREETIRAYLSGI